MYDMPILNSIFLECESHWHDSLAIWHPCTLRGIRHRYFRPIRAHYAVSGTGTFGLPTDYIFASTTLNRLIPDFFIQVLKIHPHLSAPAPWHCFHTICPMPRNPSCPHPHTLAPSLPTLNVSSSSHRPANLPYNLSYTHTLAPLPSALVQLISNSSVSLGSPKPRSPSGKGWRVTTHRRF
jgi:hypothetical protein